MWNFGSTDCPLQTELVRALMASSATRVFPEPVSAKTMRFSLAAFSAACQVEKSLMTLITLKTITPLAFSRLCLQLPWQRCFSHGVAAESTFSNGSGAVDAVELSLFWCSHLALPRCLESLASLMFRFLGWESWSLYFKLYHYFYNF